MVVEDGRGMSVRGLQTMLRGIAFNSGDIPTVIPDGIFGEKTKDSVLAFQRAYGLPINGEVDVTTWQRIRDVYFQLEEMYNMAQIPVIISEDINYIMGDETLELSVIQAMMLAISGVVENMPEIEVTGIHDNKSVNGVAFIQEKSGLEPTGVIDIPTSNAIIYMYSANVIRQLEKSLLENIMEDEQKIENNISEM